MNLRKQKN